MASIQLQASGEGGVGATGAAREAPAKDPGEGVADKRLARIVRLAAHLFAAPRAAVAVIEGPRLVTRAAVGEGWCCPDALCQQARREGRPIFLSDLAPEARRKDASDLGFYAAAPLVSEAGQVIGVLCVGDFAPRPDLGEAERADLTDLAALAALEITQATEAAAARERTALALTAAGLADYEWDIKSQEIRASGPLLAMIGWDAKRGAIRRSDMRGLIHPEDREATIAAIGRMLASSGRYAVETRIIRPADGRTVWIASSGVYIPAEDDGEPHRVFGVMQDIPDRKVEEEQRETLVAELDHRVKNVLAAVQSLAAQSARKAASLEGFLKTFAGRLKSMASAHQLLTATRWRGASLHNIAAAELGGLAPGQTRWSGPDVILTPRGANAMSLALHELATNAVKFGSLSTEVGRVEVTWRRTGDRGLELQWLESHGPEVRTPTRRGFGATLLEKVTGRELDGSAKVEYRAEGVRAVLTVGPNALAPTPPAPGAQPQTEAEGAAGASAGASAAQQRIDVRGLKLLIVEDALLLALELEAGLTEAGAEVLGSAADVGEAMRMAQLPIDAAVLDANLNGASVAPVAEALTRRGVPFVFATGYGDDKMLPSGFEAPVIRKPYDVTQVAAALSEVTGRVPPSAV